MKGVLLEKLPPLRREGFSYSSPSSLRLQEDKERKETAMKDSQQDSFPYNNWPNPVQRKQNSATDIRIKYSEEKQNISLGRAEVGTIFPLKPGSHKKVFKLSNCQADSDYSIQKTEKSLDCLKDHWENSKQTSNRRQEKHDKNKLEDSDTDAHDRSRKRGETNSKSVHGYQRIHKDQRILYENEIQLTEEIHKKKILLQEKLLSAAERLRTVQLGTESGDKVKSKEQRSKETAENRLYERKKGNWDWESARDRALGGRRLDQQEGFNDWFREDDGAERQENHVKEMTAGQKEKRREGLEWEKKGRNTQRTTKTVEKEWDQFEMTKGIREGVRTEKDRRRREKAMEWQEPMLREWGQRDRQEKEVVKVNDGEKRRYELAKLKRDTEIENGDEQWDLMDKFASKSHIKGNVFSKHDKTNILIEDHLVAQERGHHHSNRAAEERPVKKPLPGAGTSTHNSKRLQQVQLSLESSPITHIQTNILVEDHLVTQKRGHQQSNRATKDVSLKKPLPEAGTSTHNSKRLQQVPLTLESSTITDVQIMPCKICNRTFTEDRLEKHISICQKLHKPKRQVYDSSRYRVRGTELETFMKTNGPSKAAERKKNNWRQKHETFLWSIRRARAPGSRGCQPSADVNSDYLTCPHCSRRFAPGPAERHIPKCQNIKSRPPPPRQRH